MTLSKIFSNLADTIDELNDGGLRIPQIKEIEWKIRLNEEISRYGKDPVIKEEKIYTPDEILKLRKQANDKLTQLKHQSDAERIRAGLPPKYHKYTPTQKQELLKKYPPYELDSQKIRPYSSYHDPFFDSQYIRELWKYAEKLGIRIEDIDSERNRINKLRERSGNLPITDKEVLENLITEKAKNQKEKDDFIQQIEARIKVREWNEKHEPRYNLPNLRGAVDFTFQGYPRDIIKREKNSYGRVFSSERIIRSAATKKGR